MVKGSPLGGHHWKNFCTIHYMVSMSLSLSSRFLVIKRNALFGRFEEKDVILFNDMCGNVVADNSKVIVPILEGQGVRLCIVSCSPRLPSFSILLFSGLPTHHKTSFLSILIFSLASPHTISFTLQSNLRKRTLREADNLHTADKHRGTD